MNAKIKERKNSMLWLNVERKFYKGLFEFTGDTEYLKRYYSFLHWHISRRSECDKLRGH